MAPQRQLGFWSASALVVASMIGSGVFTTSGFLLADLHTPERVLAVWAGGGVVAILGAVCYGALARRFPESGGEYLFLAQTWHPAAGNLAGWVSLLAGFSAPLAAAGLAFGEYTQPWLPFSTPRVTGSCMLVLVAAVHATHVQRGAGIQNTAVLAKLLLIAVLFCRAGASVRRPSESSATGFSWSALAVSLVWVSFSYSGWNAPAYLGSEIRNPERNLPRAMALGTGLVTLIYLGLNTVFVYAAPIERLSGRLDIGRAAAEALGGAALANFVTGLIAIVLATTLSAMMMAGPRVYARMADDGCLPRWFRFPAQGPPRRAIALQVVLALAMLWTATFQGLLTYIGFTLGLCSAAAVAGLMRLRRREGSRLRVPGWPWAPALFVISIAAISTFTIAGRPIESAIGVATLLTGAVTWHLARGKRRETRVS